MTIYRIHQKNDEIVNMNNHKKTDARHAMLNIYILKNSAFKKRTPAIDSGFTLIELMISILITTVILSAVFKLFVSNTLSYNLQQSIASVQEEGRFAAQSLSQSLMVAGFSQTNPSKAPIRLQNQAEGALVSVKRNEPNAAGQTSNAEQYTQNGTGNNTKFDQIVLLVSGGHNCAGSDVWPNIPGNNHWKYFYVNDDFQFICADSAGNNEQIAGGIEAFQVQYGVDTNTINNPGYLQPNTYVTTPLASHRVVAVRFGLIVRSRSTVKSAQQYPADHTMTLLDQTFGKGQGNNQLDFDDGHLRRLFFSTVKLRNSELDGA